MADNLESLEGMMREKLASAAAGHRGKIAMAQSRILFGGIGHVSEAEIERTAKLRQIGGIVDSSFLRKIPDWESGVTPHWVAQSLLDEVGLEDLSKWYEVNSKHPLTQDRRVVEVKTAIAEIIAKDNHDEKTA